MKGYKGMNKDMTCRGMKFEVGKAYHVKGNIEMCRNGLHFCKNLKDVFNYYDKNSSRYFEVEAEKTVISEGNKCVTSDMVIVRELTEAEINRCIYGDGYGDGYGNGYGDGYGNGDGNGNGYGYGNGNGYGNGYGYGNGNGYGNGYGNGDGYGNGYGYGNGNGYGNGYGNGNGENIQRIAIYN